MALTVALALLVLPYPSLPGRWDDTHSLDGPTWTLLQEYLGNITYALVLRHLKPAVLFALAVVAALGLVAAAVHFGTLSAGFGFGSFWMAPVRLAFPFLFGLWLHRVLDLLPSTRLGFWPLAAIMAVALALPVAGDRASDNWNGLLEAGLVIVLFPAIVLLGAHSRIGPRTLTACRTLGRLSYPLYILHYPFIYKLADYALYAHPSADALRKVALIVPPAMVMLGWAGLKLWDEPLRRRLSARLLPRG